VRIQLIAQVPTIHIDVTHVHNSPVMNKRAHGEMVAPSVRWVNQSSAGEKQSSKFWQSTLAIATTEAAFCMYIALRQFKTYAHIVAIAEKVIGSFLFRGLWTTQGRVLDSPNP
jgi:hypothetical protein